MSEHAYDSRLVSGAVITPEVWFELEMDGAVIYGRDASEDPASIAVRFKAKPLEDLRLQGEVGALSQLTGTLSIGSQREITRRAGLLTREPGGYRIGISLFEVELDRFLKLMAAGLRPRALKLEFDIEVEQWFELGQYWDDVLYPYVSIHEYRLEWSPPAPASPGPAAAVKRPKPRATPRSRAH